MNSVLEWVPRAVGWAWGVAWLRVMIGVRQPWSKLGGVVGDRVLWLTAFVPAMAIIVGLLVGTWSRRAAQRDPHRTHLLLLRRILWPQAAIVAWYIERIQSCSDFPSVNTSAASSRSAMRENIS